MATTARAETLIDEVTEHVRTALEALAETYSESGRSLAEIGPAEQIAERMLATVPSPSPWDEILGPFYPTAKVAQLLGKVSRQALADRRKRRTLLGLRTADGHVLYPVFQFNEHNEVLPGLADVLECFDPDIVDDWTVSGWLVARQRGLHGLSVIEWLTTGRPRETVVRLAREQASRYQA